MEVHQHFEEYLNFREMCCILLYMAKINIYRGYYTVVRRYEFYFRVAKQYFTNEHSK